MPRRTKIIATLGPATDDKSTIESLIRAGIDLVRINFSHGNLTDHQRRVNAVRECAANLGRAVGILGDLQGPKIRIGRIQNGCIHLEPGRKFVLDAGPAEFEGSLVAVGVDYKQLPADVNPGDFLLLDDGRIELQVDRIDDLRIICTVKTGGDLSNNKGINRKGGGLSAGALTVKDFMDGTLVVFISGPALHIRSIRLHVPDAALVVDLDIKHLPQPGLQGLVFNRGDNFDARFKVACHQVGRTDKIFLFTAVFEIVDAGMFKEPADD